MCVCVCVCVCVSVCICVLSVRVCVRAYIHACISDVSVVHFTLLLVLCCDSGSGECMEHMCTLLTLLTFPLPFQ